MNWFKWLLVAWFGFAVLFQIGMVGKRREITTPLDAIATTILGGLAIAGIIYYF